MFSVSSGWLRYAPFASYQLPTIVESGNFVPLRRSKEVEGRMVKLYRLKWPGESKHPGEIPMSIAAHWLEKVGKREQPNDREYVPSHANLLGLADQGAIPDEPPPCVAYHLTLNSGSFFDGKLVARWPLAGLPGEVASRIFHASSFTIDEHYMSALKYLSWLAESHRRHPMFTGFDTMIREMLMGVSHEATRLYFALLQDCLYDQRTDWFYRGEDKYVWGRLACYLHWVGRTGSGLYDDLSGLDQVLDQLDKLCGTYTPDIGQFPDVRARLTAWLQFADQESRVNSHVDGVALEDATEEAEKIERARGQMRRNLKKMQDAKEPETDEGVSHLHLWRDLPNVMRTEAGANKIIFVAIETYDWNARAGFDLHTGEVHIRAVPSTRHGAYQLTFPDSDFKIGRKKVRAALPESGSEVSDALMELFEHAGCFGDVPAGGQNTPPLIREICGSRFGKPVPCKQDPDFFVPTPSA